MLHAAAHRDNHDPRDGGYNDQWIRERTGISGAASPNPTWLLRLATAAAWALVARGIEATELDAILVCTVTPDMFFPSTACLVQNNLGAKGAWGFDLVAACSGFVYGLTTGACLVACGTHRKVLVIGADTMTRIIDYTERGTCVLGMARAPCCWNPPPGRTVWVLSTLGDRWSPRRLLKCRRRQPCSASCDTVTKRLHYVHQDLSQVFKCRP